MGWGGEVGVRGWGGVGGGWGAGGERTQREEVRTQGLVGKGMLRLVFE